MPGTPPLFKLVSLLYRLKDGIEFKDFVLEPHFDIDEGVCQRLWQIVKVFLQLLIFRILEEELLLGQLVLLRQILLAAEVHIDFGAVSQHRVQLVLVQKLVETVGPRVILLVLPMHNVDVVDELGQEVMHAFGSRRKFHDLVQ